MNSKGVSFFTLLLIHSLTLINANGGVVHKDCDFTVQVTCTDNNGNNCDDIKIPKCNCKETKFTYQFTFCNNEKKDLTINQNAAKVMVKNNELKWESGLEEDVVKTGECLKKDVVTFFDTCEGEISGSIFVGGKLESGKYCQTYDHFWNNVLTNEGCDGNNDGGSGTIVAGVNTIENEAFTASKYTFVTLVMITISSLIQLLC